MGRAKRVKRGCYSIMRVSEMGSHCTPVTRGYCSPREELPNELWPYMGAMALVILQSSREGAIGLNTLTSLSSF